MSMISNTIVSIIIPVYNVDKYLGECLDSVLSQTLAEWECILIDDGSTDDSASICDDYASRDDRFSVIHKINEGVSTARNRGLDMAKGDYVTFVDADDVLLPDALDVLYKNQQGADADIVCAEAYRWEGERKERIINIGNRIVHGEVLLYIAHFALWAQLFRADVIRNYSIRFIDGLAYSEDAVFISEYSLYSSTIVYTSTPVYLYRIHTGSACRIEDREKVAYHEIWAGKEILKLSGQKSLRSEDIRMFLNKQSSLRLKFGIDAFLRTDKRFLIAYQMRFCNAIPGPLVSKSQYLKLYSACFYKYVKNTIKRFWK